MLLLTFETEITIFGVPRINLFLEIKNSWMENCKEEYDKESEISLQIVQKKLCVGVFSACQGGGANERQDCDEGVEIHRDVHVHLIYNLGLYEASDEEVGLKVAKKQEKQKIEEREHS